MWNEDEVYLVSLPICSWFPSKGTNVRHLWRWNRALLAQAIQTQLQMLTLLTRRTYCVPVFLADHSLLNSKSDRRERERDTNKEVSKKADSLTPLFTTGPPKQHSHLSPNHFARQQAITTQKTRWGAMCEANAVKLEGYQGRNERVKVTETRKTNRKRRFHYFLPLHTIRKHLGPTCYIHSSPILIVEWRASAASWRHSCFKCIQCRSEVYFWHDAAGWYAHDNLKNPDWEAVQSQKSHSFDK